MNLLNDCYKFYEKNYILTFCIHIFYKYITYVLCVLYLFWFPIYIIKTNNLHNFSSENITNISLIFYSFYKIHSVLINKYNFTTEIIFEIIFLTCAIYDISNSNHLYHIEYCIVCSLGISAVIFVYGTFYCIVKGDFSYDRELYYDYVSEILSEIV